MAGFMELPLPSMDIPIIHSADIHEWDAATVDALSNEISLIRWGTVGQTLLIS